MGRRPKPYSVSYQAADGTWHPLTNSNLKTIRFAELGAAEAAAEQTYRNLQAPTRVEQRGADRPLSYFGPQAASLAVPH